MGENIASKQVSKPRVIWVDILRIIACFAVIILHTAVITVYSLDQTSPTHFGWWGGVFWDSLTRFAVPLFIMISGGLFISKKTLSIKSIWLKYIPRIFLVYIVWVIIYSIFNPTDMTLNLSLTNLLKTIALDRVSHLWFLPMLIIVYACLPVLKQIASNKKILNYTLIFFICILAYETISAILVNSISWYTDEIQGLLNIIPISKIAKSAIIYCGYALLGYYLYKYKLSKKNRGIIYISTIVSILFIVLMTGFVNRNTSLFNEAFFYSHHITVMLEASTLFLLAKHSKTIKSIQNEKKIKLISILSSCSLGIYLVHILVLRNLSNYQFFAENLVNRYSWICIPILSIGVFIISLIITVALKKTHKIVT